MHTIKIPIPGEENKVLAVTSRNGQIRLETRTSDGDPSGLPVIIPDDPKLIATLCQTLLGPHVKRLNEAA